MIFVSKNLLKHECKDRNNKLYVCIEGLSDNVSPQTQNIWNECIIGHKKG